MAMQQLNTPTSGQLVPKYSGTNKSGKATPFIINGCAVSITSTPKSTDEPIKAVKEILLSAYRTRRIKG